MVFLLETMVNEKNITRILPTMGYDHFEYMLPINHSGGVAVMWNNGHIYASVLFKETRAIHILVLDVKKAQNCVVLGICAPAQDREKNSFWEHLIEINAIIDLPTFLIGDFNELAAPNEKVGVNPYLIINMTDLIPS